MNTKMDIIQGMYSQLRISGLTVQPTPEDVGVALLRFEDMMDEFSGSGLCLGYNFEQTPDAASESGLARKYRHMAQTNLAVRTIPDFNKVVPQSLYAQASQSYSKVFGMVALENLRTVQAPRRMARGSGNTLRYNRWQRFNRPAHLPDNNCQTNNIIESDINDYIESFEAYLEGETIASFTITATTALNIISSSNDDNNVNYRIEANSPTTSGTGQTVTITITTSTGRIHTHTVGFVVDSKRVD